MLYAGSDAPEPDVPDSTGGHDATHLVGPSYIAPIVVSHTEVNILKFQFFNTC